MQRPPRLRLILALAVATCACDAGRSGTGTNPGTDDGGMPTGGSHDMAGSMMTGHADMAQPLMTTLTVSPPDSNLAVDGVHSGTVTYKAVDKSGNDVSSKCAWSVDNGKLGTFAGNVFTSTPGMGGATTVRATLGSDTGYTALTIKLTSTVVVSGSAGDFGGASSSGVAPALVYPPDGVLIPPNINSFEVQWTPGAGNTEYAVHFGGDALDLTVVTKCTPVGNGCVLAPDPNTWKTIAEAGRGSTLQVNVAGTAGNGQPVGTSSPRKVSFADEDVQGGIYYWNAASGGIYRYDFGLLGKTAENWYTPGQAGAMCVGCHAIARQGSRLAAGLNIPGPATMVVLDVATRKTLYTLGSSGGFGIPGGPGSNFEALTDDGSRVITSESSGIVVRDSASGNVVGNNPGVPNGMMPDISPDGGKVVFARGGGSCIGGLCGSAPGIDMAGLNIVSFNGTTFGPTQGLVAPGGHNNYYPQFSPDGQFVVFNRADNNSYDAPDARVMVVKATAGSNPVIDLQAINNVSLGNSWPKWAPFIGHFQGAPVYWVTFSSRRPYGVHPQTMTQNSQTNMNEANAQIWMAGVDMGHLAAASDGSFPAFWLPFQDPATGNHIAQWVSKVDRAPCSQVDQSGCMSGEMCYMGQCIPNPM